MRRADRLFRIVQVLRGRRLTTAAQLAGWLNVSERTIYRDVRDLMLSGSPIEGEAGVGYRLRVDHSLPPLMFEADEIEALTLGAHMVEAWSSPALAAAAISAVAKIAAALPPEKRVWIEASRVFVPKFHIPAQLGERFETLRSAIRAQRKVQFACVMDQGGVSQHTVYPLSLYFWGEQWTLAAWCETHHDFETFRLDRVLRLQTTREKFVDAPGRRLADFTRTQAVARPTPRTPRASR